MKKLGAVLVIIGVIIAAYILILVVMPTVTDIASTANASLHATSNMSDYPGTAEGIIAIPWILMFVPAVIGLAVIVLILRHKG